MIKDDKRYEDFIKFSIDDSETPARNSDTKGAVSCSYAGGTV